MPEFHLGIRSRGESRVFKDERYSKMSGKNHLEMFDITIYSISSCN
jgi:hypothetical protein